jgi:ribosomal-protein-alanine N-acetyltransferase
LQRRSGDAFSFVICREGDRSAIGTIAVEPRAEGGFLYGEIGYWVARSERRRGVASRAIALAASWASESLKASYLEVQIAPENHGSRRLVEASGFELQGHKLNLFKGQTREFCVYRLPLGASAA